MLGLGASLSSLYVPQSGSSYTNPYSVEFDGSNDKIVFPKAIFQSTMRDSFTLTMWIKPGATGNQSWFGSGGTDYVFVNFDGSGNISFRFKPNGVHAWAYWSGITLSSTAWFHFAFSVQKVGTGSSNSVFQGFMNGSKLTTPLMLANTTAADQGAFEIDSGDWEVGAAGGNGQVRADTRIHDFSLHSAVLADNAITSIYNSGDSSIDLTQDSGDYSSSNLTGYWKLDEGTGTTATDSAGSTNGTLTNGPTWVTDSPS